jgi:hypothetical protein
MRAIRVHEAGGIDTCWMARPTSPERSCSRSQTDHQAELADALVELRTEPHLGPHPRLVEEVGEENARHIERPRGICRRETDVPQCLQATLLDHPSNGKPVVKSQTERPTIG